MASERGEWMEVEGRPFESGLGYVPEDDFWDVAKKAWNQALRVNPKNPEAVIGQIEAMFKNFEAFSDACDIVFYNTGAKNAFIAMESAAKAAMKGPSDERKSDRE